MTERATLLVLAGVLVAAAISLIFFSSVLVAARPPEGRPGVLVGSGPAPSRPPIAVVQQRLPQDLRFLAPVVVVQRNISDAARDGAGLLLALLLTSGTLVVARDQVVRVYAASSGGWRAQARVLGIGLGVLFALASAVLLAAIFFLGALAGRPLDLFRFGVQFLFGVVAVLSLVVLLPALLGYAAASWRVGMSILAAPPWRRATERIPAAGATLLGAALLYLLAQLPGVGWVIGLAVLAYALGAFVLTRLAPRGA